MCKVNKLNWINVLKSWLIWDQFRSLWDQFMSLWIRNVSVYRVHEEKYADVRKLKLFTYKQIYEQSK